MATAAKRVFPHIPADPKMSHARRALHLQQHWAFWEATPVSACIEAGVSLLYSEDLPGRTKVEALEIANPFA